jgi:hypothetical protein
MRVSFIGGLKNGESIELERLLPSIRVLNPGYWRGSTIQEWFEYQLQNRDGVPVYVEKGEVSK